VERSTRPSAIQRRTLLVAPLAIVLFVVALTPGPVFAGIMSDLRGYFEDTGRLLAGVVPYRGFPLEYPPLALVPMTLPRLWPFGALSDGVLVVGFAVMEGCLAVVVGWLITRVSADPIRALATWALVVLLAGGSIAWRYDLWPAAAVLVAFVATERGRPGLAGAAIGVGTMLKLFPIVVLPVLAARAIALRDWTGLIRLVVGTAIVVGFVMGVSFVAAGPDSFGWLTYEIDRGLQLESTGSGILLLLHIFAGQPFDLVLAFGTLQVVAPGADAIVAATPYLEMALVGGVALVALVAFRRDVRRLGQVPRESLAIAIVAVIVALVVTSKVFSAQYVVWFLPLIPFLPGRVRLLGLVIAGLSTLIYPLNYMLLWHLDPVLAVVLNVRNALLIVFVVLLAVRLARPSSAST
jgi:Glycosyltransferase family 87